MAAAAAGAILKCGRADEERSVTVDVGDRGCRQRSAGWLRPSRSPGFSPCVIRPTISAAYAVTAGALVQSTCGLRTHASN